MDGFPHQLIMKLPLKINIEKLTVNDLDIVYEELSKVSGQSGKVYANGLHGIIYNLTNLPDAIKTNRTDDCFSFRSVYEPGSRFA